MPVVQSVDKSSFDPIRLDLFWQFIAERQWVWHRRVVQEQDRPWTEDPILQKEFFTNIYRRLDPGTQFVIERILDSKRSAKAKLFQVMFYRLTGSQPETFLKVAKYIHPEKYDQERVWEILQKLHEKSSDYIFGDAYRVASYSDMGGDGKAENISLLFEKVINDGILDVLFDELMDEAEDIEQLYRAVSRVQGFGEFLAYQIVLDITTPNSDGVQLFEADQNDWAIAGPGARKGLWKMLKDGIKPANLLLPMRWLAEHQDEEFERLAIAFPYLLDDEEEPIRLTVADIQTALCEYFKYVRIWDGETKSVRGFKPLSEPDDLAAGEVGVEDPGATITPPVPPPSTPKATVRDDPLPMPSSSGNIQSLDVLTVSVPALRDLYRNACAVKAAIERNFDTTIWEDPDELPDVRDDR